MTTYKLSPDQWWKIVCFLRLCPNVYVGNQDECRRFVEGVIWINRTGAQWRELPERFGKWNSVYKRYTRWCDNEVWQRMHEYFVQDPDMEYLIPDSTVIRAHPCAAGAPGKKGGNQPKHSAAVEVDSAPRYTPSSTD